MYVSDSALVLTEKNHALLLCFSFFHSPLFLKKPCEAVSVPFSASEKRTRLDYLHGLFQPKDLVLYLCFFFFLLGDLTSFWLNAVGRLWFNVSLGQSQ